MWLIVGLGNPGKKYEKTRHNIGFLVVDALADNCGIEFKEKEHYRIASGSMGNDKVILLEPLTFMNRSGSAVRHIRDKKMLEHDHIIVVHDDLDLEPGKIKIRRKGSSGGHKGIESIIQFLGSNEFIRVKIGIGRDISMLTEEYVLSKFRKDELPVIKDSIEKTVKAVQCIIADGVDRAMNRFH